MSAQDVIQLLGKAILDPAFRAHLLSDPEWALNQFSLTGSERDAIQNIKPDQLQALVDQFAKGGDGNVNQFLMKMVGDPGIMPNGLGGPDTIPIDPCVVPGGEQGGPQPHLEQAGPAPHLEQGGIGDPGIKPGGSWPASPEGEVSGDVNGDMPGGIGDPGIKEGGPTPHMQPGEMVDPGDMQAAPLEPCVVPGEIGDPGIAPGGPSPHMQPGGERALPEPHMRPGGGAQEAGGGVWVPSVLRLLLPALLLLLLGLLLFGPPSLVGGFLSPLDAIGCTGVENVEQEGMYSSPGVILVSYALQAPESPNTMAGFFDALNGLRAGLGQRPIPYHPDCRLANEPVVPNTQCGNGIVDQGEECDGSNDMICTAQSGVSKYCGANCQCVVQGAAVCGNNHTDPGEQCDGSDDVLCTIQAGAIAKTCGQNCQCVPVGGSQGGEACVPIAGDGICSACENTDLDSDSCVCTINGVCDVGEGFNCPDCGPTAMPDSCANSSCGDGKCSAACGEDINTCAVDCHL